MLIAWFLSGLSRPRASCFAGRRGRIPEIRSPATGWHALGMVTRVPGEQLLGRQREREVLDRVLETARGGHGGALAVYGEPGVGKTALLDAAVETAADFRVARAVGVEGEMGFPFAALHQLCSPSLDLLDRLPDPQREAFAVALGLSAGRTPNPFLVGLAVLNLLSEAAEEQPLLCAI